jgi:hypothetical protein
MESNGLTVDYVGIGLCSLTPSVTNGIDYTATTGSAQILVVGQATPATPIITNLPTSAMVGGNFIASVRTTGDGDIYVTSNSSSICTVESNGLTVDFDAPGTCSLAAGVQVGVDYTAAIGTAQTFIVAIPLPDPPTTTTLPDPPTTTTLPDPPTTTLVATTLESPTAITYVIANSTNMRLIITGKTTHALITFTFGNRPVAAAKFRTFSPGTTTLYFKLNALGQRLLTLAKAHEFTITVTIRYGVKSVTYHIVLIKRTWRS